MKPTNFSRREFGLGADQRKSNRRALSIPGRMVWRDTRGTTRFATVMTRDVSESGVAVQCLSGAPIPLYRLVHLQLERTARFHVELPHCLRQGKVLSAVYRIGPSGPKTGTPDTYALRLLVEPAHRNAESQATREEAVESETRAMA
jgi:hypothetical protein